MVLKIRISDDYISRLMKKIEQAGTILS